MATYKSKTKKDCWLVVRKERKKEDKRQAADGCSKALQWKSNRMFKHTSKPYSSNLCMFTAAERILNSYHFY
jgi:hypothetical protein